MTRGLQKRLGDIGALAATATLVTATVASASTAVKGASYVGSYSDGLASAITFKVSANGKRVVELDVSTPIKCQGGCGGIGSASHASAAISKRGKFKINRYRQLPFQGRQQRQDRSLDRDERWMIEVALGRDVHARPGSRSHVTCPFSYFRRKALMRSA